MKEHYVTYEQAVKLKELGFDEPCYNFWTLEPEGKPLIITSILGDVRSSDLKGRDVAAPFLWQAQAWLREEKGIIVWVCPEFYEGDALEDVRWYFYAQSLQDLRKQVGGKFCCGYYSTYESALSAGIDAALELLIKQQP